MSPKTSLDDAQRAERLLDILLRSLKFLADRGEVEQACRLAGEACVTLHNVDCRSARRFDALLHRLTKVELN
jgi:hypothetical protein